MAPARQLVVSLIAFVVVGVGAGVWWTRSSAPAYATGPGHFYVVEASYSFSPSHMVWRVGERVSLTLANQDQSHPPKNHMFMMGRGGLWENPTPFGHPMLTGGWHQDFFKGVTVAVSHARNVLAVFHPNNQLTGPEASAPFVMPFKKLVPGPPVHVQPPNLGVVLSGDQGTVTLVFTVPDKPGRWQFGCFEQNSLHYVNGMRGTVEVVG